MLGVNFAAGTAFLALVRAPDQLVLDHPVKIAPSDSLTDVVRLKDFGDRFVQQARELGVSLVAVAHPRLYGGWTYADAFERVSLETTLMLSLKPTGIEYRCVKQDGAAKAIGVSKPKHAPVELAKALSLSGVVHWNNRSVALMVALVVAKELSS